jgi:predicted metal-dependent HD superfamily phosphohydrolase
VNLEERWHSLCARLNADDLCASTLWHLLQALYAWPPRHYHNLDHIAACLFTLDQFASHAQHPEEVELALWLHDSIYIPGRGDNERRSAAVALMFARELAHPPAAADRIATLVLATSHASPPSSGDAGLIADIDMAILAAPPEQYERYAHSIAAEYAFAGPERYRQGRAAFLQNLLHKPAIFHHPALRARFESLSRQNLAAEIAILQP